MAVFSLTSATVLVGAAWTGTAPGTSATPSGTITSTTDLSSMLIQVQVSMSSAELASTNFASGGWEEKISGLANGSIALTFNQDFAASKVDALFGIGGTFGFAPGQVTPYYLDVKPTSSSRAATNPSYLAAFLNMGGDVINGSVGDIATVTYTFPFTGRFHRLTS